MKNIKLIISASLSCLALSCMAPGVGTNPSASPSGSASPSVSGSATPASSTTTANGTISAKQQMIQFYECALNNPSFPASLKSYFSTIITNLKAIDDSYFLTNQAAYETYLNGVKGYCDQAASASPAPSSTPSPASSATLTPVTTTQGYTEYNCSAEGTLKSGSGKSINVSFNNLTGQTIKVYWLDSNGKRVSYNASLAAGKTHPQQTFVTHPWLFADANDNCLKIYVPGESAGSLDIK